jgi:hypothetical protein
MAMYNTGNAFELGVKTGVDARGWDRNRKARAKRKGDNLANDTEKALKEAQTQAARYAGGTARGTTGVNATGVVDTTPDIEALYKQQYDLAEKQRKRRLDATIQANNDAAERSLADAYVAYMLQQRNLPQQLRANGINGGATETTLGDLSNTYQNSRNKIMLGRDDANAQARLAYDSRVAEDYDKFLTNKINLAIANMNNAAQLARQTPTRTSSNTWNKASTTGGTSPSGVAVGYQSTRPARNATANRLFNGVGYGSAGAVGVAQGANDVITSQIRALLQQGYSYDQIKKMYGY